MKTRVVIAVLTMCSMAVMADVELAIGPYEQLGIGANGVWLKEHDEWRMPQKAGCLDAYYVTTNSDAVIYQFNLRHDFKEGTTVEQAIKELGEAKDWFSKHISASEFTSHVDSNPNRYLWSEEASLVDYPHWSVRIYLDKGMNPNHLVGTASVWNARRSQR